MASIFQPPPTYALPVVVDEVTGRSVFNPIWLRWFLDLSKGLSAGGTPSGAIVGPPTSIAGHVVLWDNATGSLLKDGGQLGTAAYQNSTVFQPAGTYLSAVTTDTTLTGAGTGALPLSVVKTSPVTIMADYTILDTDQWIINNKGSACVLTFPAASLWPGRAVTTQNYQAFTVTSASANIVPRGGGAATTAILAGVVGNWVTVVSDGTNWAILQAAP